MKKTKNNMKKKIKFDEVPMKQRRVAASEIAKRNVEFNNVENVLCFESGEMYPLHDEDKFVQM